MRVSKDVTFRLGAREKKEITEENVFWNGRRRKCFFFKYINFYFLNEGYFRKFIQLLGAPAILLGAPSNSQVNFVPMLSSFPLANDWSSNWAFPFLFWAPPFLRLFLLTTSHSPWVGSSLSTSGWNFELISYIFATKIFSLILIDSIPSVTGFSFNGDEYCVFPVFVVASLVTSAACDGCETTLVSLQGIGWVWQSLEKWL